MEHARIQKTWLIAHFLLGISSVMLKLYSYRRCPFAMRVRMVLFEKNIPFQTIEENLKEKSVALQKLHPQARVPVLVDGDFVIYESAIITQYLQDAYPKGPDLLPKDPKLRAQVRLWTHWCHHEFKPHVDHYKYGHHRSSDEDVQAAPARLVADLKKLQSALFTHNYLLGPTMTLADIHVFPFLRQLCKATPYFEPLNQFAKPLQWLENMVSRPSFKLTMQKVPHHETA